MSDTNPYSSPTSDLEVPSSTEGDFEIHDPRSVPAGNGMKWIGEGFDYFKMAPGSWILLLITGFAIMLVINVIPGVSLLASLSTYIWIGGLMIGCQALHDGKELKVKHLFAGFEQAFGPLFGLSALLFVLNFVVLIVIMLIFLLPALTNPEAFESMLTDNPMMLVLAGLVAMLFVIPITMMGWFSPILIAIHKVPMTKAMAMSFKGCMRNIVPFLLYGIVMLILFIAGALLLGLGLLVVIPIAYGSMFMSFKDIYID